MSDQALSNNRSRVPSLGGTALAQQKSAELTVNHPGILKVSEIFNWRPERALRRIKDALPAVFEQQLYIVLAPHFKIHPETLAKLRKIYSNKPLSIDYLKRKDAGQGLRTNPLGNFSDFFGACMSLVKVVTKEYGAFALSMEIAGRIVVAYGVEVPESAIEMIDDELDNWCELFHVDANRSYSERMRICTWILVDDLLPQLEDRGIPAPLRFDDVNEYEWIRESFESADSNAIERQLAAIRNGGLICEHCSNAP